MSVNKFEYFKTIGYKPHFAQMKYHKSESRFRIPSCGRRMGKTTMVARDRAPELLQHKNTGWIIGPTYDLGEKEFRVMWDDLIVGQELGKDKRLKKAYNKRTGEMFIRFPWGASVEVRSAAHPEKLVGESLDWAIFSEAAKHDKDTWERYVRPALSDRRGTADFPSTPEGFNWYYDLWRMGQNPDSPEYESWKFPSWINTVVFPGGRDDPEIRMVERTTTPEYFMQEYGADFASFVGKIYGEFDELVHVKTHEYNPAWPTYGAFDWGFVHPLVFIEFQVSPSDTIHVFREHYLSYHTLDEHINILKQRENPPGYHLDLTFGDAADPEAIQYVRQNFAMCVADGASKTNWRQGVDLVKTFLKLRHDGTSYDEAERPIEVPKYFVDHSCENHIREMSNYRAKGLGAQTSESNSAGMAKKQEDHTLDAMRYALVHLYELGYQGGVDNREFADVDTSQVPVRSDTMDPGYGIFLDRVTTNMRF